MSLKEYHRKRNFTQTPEPKGKSGSVRPSQSRPLRFVVQMHSATRLHYDFRLEFEGVFKSWAVPRGPSLNPQDQRLAVFVEDHPLEYGSFEGIIPKGNYGAGTVMLWDEGTYVERGSEDRKQSETAMKKGFKKGHMTFVLNGQKLKGEFALIQLKKSADEKAWLLVKKRDEHSTYKRTEIPNSLSVKTGRTLEAIAAQSLSSGDVWLSKRKTQPIEKKQSKAKLPKQLPNSISDAMPRNIKPMIATLSRQTLQEKDWIYEPEKKGLRALAEVEGKQLRFYSKSGLPFEKRFPKIAEELRGLGCRAVFDGEIIQKSGQSVYSIFDILYGDGKDLRKDPLRDRKKVLKEVLPKKNKQIELAETHSAPGAEVSARWIAKNLDSAYRSGTTSDWLIIEKRPLRTSSEVSPSLRSSVPPKTVSIDLLRFTHLDRVLWPEEEITKGDLIEYYREISSRILPYLKDRPESLNRQPRGIHTPGFYQKDMIGHIPRWLKTERIVSESAGKTIDYVLCQDERSLLYLVNLGCIELHPWFSRIGNLENPDFLVIDLDPDGNDFSHVIEIAQEVHQILDDIGAQNFCKTSGSTGIHIGVPVGGQYDYDTCRHFAELVCRVVARKYPATTSMERSPSRRRKKIYLDFMQNRRGQTLAAPYCVRPRPGAPVSMPVTWKELTSDLKPEHFHIKNALRHIQKRQDPWKGVLGKAIDLEACIQRLKKKYKISE